MLTPIYNLVPHASIIIRDKRSFGGDLNGYCSASGLSISRAIAATAFPLVRPQPKLVDGQPLTAPRLPAGTPPLPQPAGYTWYWVTPLLLILSLALIALPRRHSHYYQFERTAVRKGTIQ
jgi:hypothetical protein